MALPTLDHVVVDARESIDAAAEAYTALGFQLTPRGHHTLGSSNNLAIFGTNYLELLGFGQNGGMRPELMPFPAGLNGLVFKTDNAADTAARAQQAGIAASPASAFSRPVTVDGTTRDAKFRTTHLPPDVSGIGRVYFCEHLTPELVWRPTWQVHPNGAQQVIRVLVATDDPSRQTRLFAGLFSDSSVASRADGTAALSLSDGGTVVLAPVTRTLEALGDAAPDAAGRANFMAALVIRVASIDAVARLLLGLPGLEADRHRVVVPAKAAFNTTLIFEDEHAD
ncbi:MAG TPA: VOC family protein [Rhodopila sp.]|nr:VOC family protein [Rhodopila sp.]